MIMPFLSKRSAPRVARLTERLVIFSTPEECEVIVAELVALGRSFGIDGREAFEMQMALEAALSNAVEHGNNSHATKKIWVEFGATEDEVRVRITDQGFGFDTDRLPKARPACEIRPCDHGLVLMRSLMSGLRLNRRGNSVEMWKRRGSRTTGVQDPGNSNREQSS